MTEMVIIISSISVGMTGKITEGIIGMIGTFTGVVVWMIREGKEMVGIIIMMLYIGAISVILVYVIMMMRIKEQERRIDKGMEWPIGIIMMIVGYLSVIGKVEEKKVGEEEVKEVGMVNYEEWIRENREIKNYIMMFREQGYEVVMVMIILIGALIGGIVIGQERHKGLNEKKVELYKAIERRAQYRI